MIASVLSLGAGARAEQVQFACDGEMEVVPRNVREKYTLAITVDLSSAIVTVGSWGSAPIFGPRDNDTLVFMAKPDQRIGVSTGTLNRITGVASVHIITATDGLYKFYGSRADIGTSANLGCYAYARPIHPPVPPPRASKYAAPGPRPGRSFLWDDLIDRPIFP